MDRRPVPLDSALSERMSKVRRRDTKPELNLRRELHARGLRYRIDRAPIAGIRSRADIVFASARVAIYVDGCFWHRCPEHSVAPKNNRAWWDAKLTANFERDRRTDRQLAEAGWTVVRVWEHEDPTKAADRVERVVRTRRCT
jgi:DNA mismatch endonuclease (patch repair protein)